MLQKKIRAAQEARKFEALGEAEPTVMATLVLKPAFTELLARLWKNPGVRSKKQSDPARKFPISPNTLTKWKGIAGKGKRDASFYSVVEVLKWLEIRRDEIYLTHWFDEQDVPNLSAVLDVQGGAGAKWWSPLVPDLERPKPTLPPVARDNRALDLSRVINAFRIPEQDSSRESRVTQLVAAEVGKPKPKFRLSASSGRSYLHEKGFVWKTAGLGNAIRDGVEVQVVLASPFSVFGFARAVANVAQINQWSVNGMDHRLEQIQKDHKNVEIRVTGLPINCSLFFTSESVFYDPYLWGSPDGNSTENNFWVFEFGKVDDAEYDCYRLLELHFDLLWDRSVPLADILRNYDRRNDEFERFLSKCVGKPSEKEAKKFDMLFAVDLISRLANSSRR